jgi:hypothetical protein
MTAEKHKLEFGGKKSLVVVITALMIGTGFLAFAPGTARADAPILAEQYAGPSPVSETGQFNAYSNWTHVNDPGPPVHLVTTAELYFQPEGQPGCSGTPMGPMMPPMFLGGIWLALWQNLVPNTMADWAGPGTYNVTMRAQDNGPPPNPPTWSACSPAIQIIVTGPDTTPPMVGMHGLTPPPTSDPMFTVNPASTTTVLQYTVTDEMTGGTDITDAEYFYCAEVTPGVPCGPDPSWIDDAGSKPDEPLPLDPWWPLPPPPPQTWDTRTRLFLNTTVDVSLWTPGTYWFYIHGADCGQDAVCEGGLPTSDDNWGDFQNGAQEGRSWYEISLVVSTGGNNPPILNWTAEPGYIADGVDPDSGDTSTLFEFRIDYRDADDDPPSSIQVHIDKPCGVPMVGSPFAMTEVNPLDLVYSDGKLYNFTTMLITGNYEHYFTASDGIDPATGAPTVPCTAGPTVTGGVTPPAPPPNLWVERSNPDMIVHWDAVAGADSYNVYRSMDRHAPFSLWTQTTGVMTNSWTHLGAYGDTNNWYYIARALNTTGGESTNSTMGVKLHKDFGTPSGTPGRNVYWISLPYVSMFTDMTASDLVMEIEGSMGAPSMINGVCKWNPATQNAMVLLYAGGRWRGNDFTIRAGDGICLNSINPAWTWVINGTDTRMNLDFIYNIILGNVNWISMPYTNSYQSASEIVRDIEGSMVTPPTRITVVAMWDPAAQALVKFEWTGAAWTGTDFTVDSGDGLYLDILSTFTWQPDLITPSVP